MRAVVPFIFLILTGAAWAADLPHVTAPMRSADFWIGRHPSADRIVMRPAQIAAFNRRLCATGLTDDLAVFPRLIPGAKVKALVAAQADAVLRQELFRRDGASVDAALKAALTEGLGLVPKDVLPRYALAAGFTDERLLPTDEPFYAKPGDVDFDEVQNSGLDPATPLIVLHQSADGAWVFVKDGISAGWVRSDALVFMDEKAWRKMLAAPSVTVIAARADIFLDEAMGQSLGQARMGARFMVRKIGPRHVEIAYPVRLDGGAWRIMSAFMRADDVVPGVLPYSARTVITQAFKLLDAPYGWGDMNGQQDCSRFIHMVFATVGLHLPRNSGEQGRVGVAVAGVTPDLAPQAKGAAIAGHAIGGLTLLRLKGHIMLYLGALDGRLYAIHAMWAYRQQEQAKERVHVVGRVAVSDLSLGEGSSKGSLLERVVGVRSLVVE